MFYYAVIETFRDSLDFPKLNSNRPLVTLTAITLLITGIGRVSLYYLRKHFVTASEQFKTSFY